MIDVIVRLAVISGPTCLQSLPRGRFASFVMDAPYLLAAVRYVERNPVKAKLVRHAAAWSWSSAAAQVSGEPDGVVETG